jgi:protein SCO1/2
MKTISLVFFVSIAASAARAGDSRPLFLREVEFDQRLGAQVPLGVEFNDEAGRTVRFGDCCEGKPTILVLAYFRCPMLCTQVLNNLTKALRGLEFTIGQEFNVVTVSFDARETPELAAAKKANYVEDYGRPGDGRGWHFLTGTQESIDALTAAVGFRCLYDPKADQFAHASGIVVLTPGGEVSRYFYGIDYPPRTLRLGLVEASDGKVGSAVDKVLLFCFHYDASAGKYTATVMNLVRLAGGLTVLLLGVFLGRAWRRDRRAARLTAT